MDLEALYREYRGQLGHTLPTSFLFAAVVELVDTQDRESCARKGVQVQLLSAAHFMKAERTPVGSLR